MAALGIMRCVAALHASTALYQYVPQYVMDKAKDVGAFGVRGTFV